MNNTETTNEARLRRANSWLKAGLNGKSNEEIFIFLWIAFNAAYGTELNDEDKEISETQRFNNFMKLIVEKDKDKEIVKYLSGALPTILKLLKNKYVYEGYWRLRDKFSEKRFNKENEDILKEWISNRAAMPMLKAIFLRLYTLRNQIIHGNKTCGDQSHGTKQLTDGCEIMKRLVPIIIKIIEDNLQEDWGDIAYPVDIEE